MGVKSRMILLLLLPTAAGLSLVGCGPIQGQDRADLTPVARAMELVAPSGEMWTARDIPALGGPPLPGAFEAPETVRMWLRSEGSSGSCSGTVVEVELEEYIRHVIPHEWYASWDEESLRSGAVAARSYAAWWVIAGGKYDCADVCDTSYTQNYGDTTDSRTDAAIAHTRGTFIMEGADVVFAEYSAENGDPTAYGVSDPQCTGEELYGHGRGMCQWGSQRWASNADKDHAWIVDHYYLGATLLPPYVASRLDSEGSLAVESGAQVTVELIWENEGSTRWSDGDVHLDSIDPVGRASDFAASDWPSDDRAATIYEDVSPGQTTRLMLSLQAPEVDENTLYTEAFGLYVQGDDDWVQDGGIVELEIEVYPAGSGPDTSDPGSEGDSGLGADDTGVDSDLGPRQRDPDALPAMDDDEKASGCGCSGGAGGAGLGFALLIAGLTRRQDSVG